jgi:hypothetical protein
LGEVTITAPDGDSNLATLSTIAPIYARGPGASRFRRPRRPPVPRIDTHTRHRALLVIRQWPSRRPPAPIGKTSLRGTVRSRTGERLALWGDYHVGRANSAVGWRAFRGQDNSPRATVPAPVSARLSGRSLQAIQPSARRGWSSRLFLPAGPTGAVGVRRMPVNRHVGERRGDRIRRATGRGSCGVHHVLDDEPPVGASELHCLWLPTAGRRPVSAGPQAGPQAQFRGAATGQDAAWSGLDARRSPPQAPRAADRSTVAVRFPHGRPGAPVNR